MIVLDMDILDFTNETKILGFPVLLHHSYGKKIWS